MVHRRLKIVARKDETPVVYFRPGDRIPETGIYRVYHSGHRLAHEVTLLHGESFPRCAKCADDVHFQLLRPAPQISRDANFRREPIRLYELPHPDEPEERQQPKRLLM